MNPDAKLTDFSLDELRALHFAVTYMISETSDCGDQSILKKDHDLLKEVVQPQLMDAITIVRKREIIQSN